MQNVPVSINFNTQGNANALSIMHASVELTFGFYHDIHCSGKPLFKVIMLGYMDEQRTEGRIPLEGRNELGKYLIGIRRALPIYAANNDTIHLIEEPNTFENSSFNLFYIIVSVAGIGLICSVMASLVIYTKRMEKFRDYDRLN
eukprot:Pgem_evm1s8744